MSSGSSGSGSYKKKVYFDPEADKSEGSKYLIDDGDLLSSMEALADVDEEILTVSIYRHRLYRVQVVEFVF
jgi:hypothetical protein